MNKREILKSPIPSFAMTAIFKTDFWSFLIGKSLHSNEVLDPMRNNFKKYENLPRMKKNGYISICSLS